MARNWKKEYSDRYQVRTAGGRKVTEGCSIEHVEFRAEQGRGREVWVWDTQREEYRFYRSY